MRFLGRLSPVQPRWTRTDSAASHIPPKAGGEVDTAQERREEEEGRSLRQRKGSHFLFLGKDGTFTGRLFQPSSGSQPNRNKRPFSTTLRIPDVFQEFRVVRSHIPASGLTWTCQTEVGRRDGRGQTDSTCCSFKTTKHTCK